MSSALEQLISTIYRADKPHSASEDEDVITVSETVSAAASLYETVRNYLEYDEEHLLRRNAISRILKRRFGDTNHKKLATDIVYELIWARYLPNKSIPVRLIGEMEDIVKKYAVLFDEVDESAPEFSTWSLWLIDMLSTEIEYHLVPPVAQEALASFTYQDAKGRAQWAAEFVREEDQDLQLYMAVHRALLKSNVATLRFRVFSLYYPDWKENPSAERVKEIAQNLNVIYDSVEYQIQHPARDIVFRAVQKHGVVYRILYDLIEKDPQGFFSLLADEAAFVDQVKKAASASYKQFYGRLRRSIIRAVIFLFFTKMIIGLVVELPYDLYVVHTTNFVPLMTNILFHPFLLAVIGISVRIPAKENTKKIEEELRSVVGLPGNDWRLLIRKRRAWPKGFIGGFFHVLYTLLFLVSIGVLTMILRAFDFNIVSIMLFLFFLSLVTFFGLKIRSGKRDLVIIESKGGLISGLVDLFFLPIIRAGRWISMNAPRVNVLLFFLDFIIDAPFKAFIRLIESWLAFLREKKEEI